MSAPLRFADSRILLLLFFLLFSIPKAAAQQSRRLELGQTLTDSFQTSASDAERVYSFDGAKGEYVEVRAQQEGCDLCLHISDSEGREIAVIDSSNGAYGPECWRGILQNSGRYQVRARCVSARSANAHFNITLSVKRAALAEDESRAKAQQLYIQAFLAKTGGTSKDSERAYYTYEKAADMYREAGDVLGEAQSLESAAALGSSVLSPSLRFELYQTSLFLFRRLRERSGEGMSLHNLGTIYVELNRLKEAMDFFQQALEAHRAVGDKRSEAIALNNLALIYCELRQPQEALRYFQKALAACRESGDHSGEAALLNNIGDIYEELGQMKEAGRYHKESEEVKK